MDRPFTAYTGEEPYIFVCYAHEDSSVVYSEIAWLRERGLNLWYDEGIAAGSNWRGAIGDSLLAANHVLFYISPRSLASAHCNREISLALDEGKNIVPVYLEAVELTSDLKVGLSRVHALFCDGTLNYRQQLLRSLGGLGSTASFLSETPNRRGGYRALPSALITILVVVLGVGWWFWSHTEDSGLRRTELRADIPSIAVLPFVNMSPDADQEYFSDGISEEILNLLARNPALRVISRSSAFSFKGTNSDLPLIAEKLGVDHVLEGSVRRSGNMVRVSVQLIDATSDGFVWSDSFDRKLDDIFAVQSEIARLVARKLNVALVDLPAERPVNSEAYLLYSQARHLLGQGMPAESSRARALLLLAVDLDPSYVRAWTELARAHGQHRGREEDAGEKAAAATERALLLDPDDPVANAWRGWELIMYAYEFEAGAQFYNRSLSKDPTNVDVLRGLVNVLTLINRPQEAFNISRYVVDRDPLCVICINNWARAFRDLGRLEESSDAYRRSLALRPDDVSAIANLAINELLQNNGDAARAWIEMLPEETSPKPTLSVMAMHLNGRTEARDSALAAMHKTRPDTYGIAMIYAFMGETDRAFAELKPIMATGPRGLPDPRNSLWGNLHADPRWDELLEDSGLSRERLARLELEVEPPV